MPRLGLALALTNIKVLDPEIEASESICSIPQHAQGPKFAQC